MKNVSMMSVTALFSAALCLSASADAWDDLARQVTLDAKVTVDRVMSESNGVSDAPSSGEEDLSMNYHVRNSSNSKITAIYFKGDDADSWSGDCLADSSARDWINSWVLHMHKSGRMHGSPRAVMVPGERERDLNGNWWMTAGHLSVDVPLDGYDGRAYRMKVCWEDGTEREFRLPYPRGDVNVYKDEVRVYLGINGRGLFYNERISAL